MWDAIVVGARCAGAPTAMLLARRGYDVLLCDRSTFPSATVSTGAFQSPGIEYLRRWGLLERLVATGVPPVSEISWSFGFGESRVNLPPAAALYAPTRHVLDALLVDAAVEAGAILRTNVTATAVDVGEGGVTVALEDRAGAMSASERARIVIGADGRRSAIARLVGASPRDEVMLEGHGAYGYFTDVPVRGYEFHIQPTGEWIMLHPSNHGWTCVTTAGPALGTPEAHLYATVDAAPAVAERVRSGTLQGRAVGYRLEPMFHRQAYGPGWALVGDAGLHHGPLSGLGMSHAFRDAEGVATSIDKWLRGDTPFEKAMSEYETQRDACALPIYDTFVAEVAAREAGGLEPTAAVRRQRLVASWANQVATK